MTDDGSGEQVAARSVRRAAIVAGSLALLGVVIIIGLVLRGGGPVVCASSARVETVDVTIVGDPTHVAAVAGLQVCGPDGCSPLPGATPTPDPTDGLVDGPPYDVQRLSGDAWRIATSLSRPKNLTIAALDSADGTIAEQRYDLVWKRNDPKAQCDLSEGTTPLTLRIP